LIADDHVPREVCDRAVACFEPPGLAQLIWAIAAINVWNRITAATRMLPGGHQS
jgi:alkylhydroperoxidase family enzyme